MTTVPAGARRAGPRRRPGGRASCRPRVRTRGKARPGRRRLRTPTLTPWAGRPDRPTRAYSAPAARPGLPISTWAPQPARAADGPPSHPTRRAKITPAHGRARSRQWTGRIGCQPRREAAAGPGTDEDVGGDSTRAVRI